MERATWAIGGIAAARMPQAAVVGDQTSRRSLDMDRLLLVRREDRVVLAVQRFRRLGPEGAVLRPRNQPRAPVGDGEIVERMQGIDVQHVSGDRIAVLVQTLGV